MYLAKYGLFRICILKQSQNTKYTREVGTQFQGPFILGDIQYP